MLLACQPIQPSSVPLSTVNISLLSLKHRQAYQKTSAHPSIIQRCSNNSPPDMDAPRRPRLGRFLTLRICAQSDTKIGAVCTRPLSGIHLNMTITFAVNFVDMQLRPSAVPKNSSPVAVRDNVGISPQRNAFWLLRLRPHAPGRLSTSFSLDWKTEI
jgi:hypothetical protein